LRKAHLLIHEYFLELVLVKTKQLRSDQNQRTHLRFVMNIDPGSTIYRTLCFILMCVACS